MFTYKTHGTCSSRIDLEFDGDVITSCRIHDGCKGNVAAINQLVVGMKIDDVIQRLKGIPCRGSTSCPDQLAKALEEYKASL
ncbi:MAG: TIGR03905 family TSCPD domain-containing protein [Christensenellales bacterium]|jgi:uncharacterized protein (TIGR03905 family)